MSGRTESWQMGKISTKSGKSLVNAFLRARTAFGFEYLISFGAEHSDAEILQESEIDELNPKIKKISSLRFKGSEISEQGFSNFPENWQN